MFKPRWLLFVLTLLVMITACGKPQVGDLQWEMQDFTFINQDEQPVGLSDLKGQVWLASFIFTNCTTVCPPMTANMSLIQRDLKEQGLNAQLVSFSVDPEVDRPEVLKEYGGKFQADFSNWHFLTGYTQAEIEKFALENFKTTVQKTSASDQVTHGTSFYLVNQDGVILKRYSGSHDTPYEEIIKDIATLTK
ncbi:SCO family protein [Ammoniphilus sp. CFH 90114]|uniref:SCO family protein n=1 Tax=Ammoniphilus sp. CFH 90114 TaxID=2493665 RepID=UPI00100FA73D|nr:SCO family protein [Ammoniphilus sp. CFH 90114]RXT04255.1 SCO family protein [Ammoniphilus sp. CFH 90114]